jgi:hypothetical protein
MSEHTDKSKPKISHPKTSSAQSSAKENQSGFNQIYQAFSNPTQETLTPDIVMYLQQRVGNTVVNRMISRMSDNDIQRTAHERGCSCPSCRQIQMKHDLVQREGGSVKERAAQFEKSSATTNFEPATLLDATAMADLAEKIGVDEFKTLAASKSIAEKDVIIALIKYFSPLTLGDLEALIEQMDDKGKKAIWSNAALLTQAEGKLGTDPYLTFATKLGMHQAPTTDELGEGGKEHTPAPEADKIIRDKMDKYVAEAVKAGKKIEGQVAVVSAADWDRAGIAHYGEDVWKTGPPPKTPKKDAINGFVDGSGRVWVEQNSGNPGTIIHEGLHKYSGDSILSQLGFYFNEGTTEYFTRIICKDLGIDRGNYDSQYAVIELLVKNVASEEILAKAYFDDDIAGLKAAFIKYRKDTKGEGDEDAKDSWKDFHEDFDDGDFSDASDYIK